MNATRFLRAPTWVAAIASSIVLLLSGCTSTPWVPPDPDLVVTASGLTNAPESVGEIEVPAGEVRWVEVAFRPLARTAPTLMVFELEGGSVGDTRIDVRDDRGRLVVASRSAQRYGRNVAALEATLDDAVVHVDTPGAAQVAPSAIVDAWTCLGTCGADRYVPGTYYVSVHNRHAVTQRYDVIAYARVPGDANEPNDTPTTATTYQVARNGDGPTGAIERPGDVDYLRMTCSASFAGPGQGMSLQLATGPTFAGWLVVDAEGGTYGVGVPTPPIPCGATVAVRSRDGSAGPAAASTYALLADAVPLYAIDAPAQSNPQTPTSLGRLVLAPGETQMARLSFGASSARLRYVEVAGAGGAAVDGLVRLELRDGAGGSIGVSRSRQRFAPALAALADAGADDGSSATSPSSITVAYQCLGPCVAERYRTGTVIARVTNTSAQTRSVDLYAYGAPETDRNEPNDTTSTATVLTLGPGGATATGALERMDDVDVFRLVCGAGFDFDPIEVTLETPFPGPMVVRLLPYGPSIRPGQVLDVPCGRFVRIETSDGSAGPSASSRYTLRAR